MGCILVLAAAAAAASSTALLLLLLLLLGLSAPPFATIATAIALGGSPRRHRRGVGLGGVGEGGNVRRRMVSAQASLGLLWFRTGLGVAAPSVLAAAVRRCCKIAMHGSSGGTGGEAAGHGEVLKGRRGWGGGPAAARR